MNFRMLVAGAALTLITSNVSASNFLMSSLERSIKIVECSLNQSNDDQTGKSQKKACLYGSVGAGPSSCDSLYMMSGMSIAGLDSEIQKQYDFVKELESYALRICKAMAATYGILDKTDLSSSVASEFCQNTSRKYDINSQEEFEQLSHEDQILAVAELRALDAETKACAR